MLGAELQAVCLSEDLACFSILGAVALDFAFNRKNGIDIFKTLLEMA